MSDFRYPLSAKFFDFIVFLSIYLLLSFLRNSLRVFRMLFGGTSHNGVKVAEPSFLIRIVFSEIAPK